MSDVNSSLPIRTENAGDAIVKVADATITSQQLAINADGSVNITDNGTSITIDGSVNLVAGAEVKITDGTDDLAVNADGSINSVVTATNLDIRDLTSVSDSVSVLQATHDNLNLNANLQVNNTDVANGNPVPISDAGGSLTVDAVNLDIRDLVFATDKVDATGSTVALDAPTLAALESVTVQNGAGVAAVNIQDGGNSITVDANNLDIRDLTHVSDSVRVGDGTDFLVVNADGSINVVISDATPGTAVNSYNTVAAVAGGATSTHTYTSTGNFNLTQIEASGSGKIKIEVQVNGTTRFVQFSSSSDPNLSIMVTQPILATTGQTVTVIRTNRENQAQDVYSTISGYLA